MALSKIPTHMYTDPTPAKMPVGSVIKHFYDMPDDVSQLTANSTTTELTSGGHRPSFTRVLGSTQSELLFDGGLAIWGDIDNDSHGYTDIRVDIKRAINGANQTTVYSEGGLSDRGGQSRTKDFRARFIDNPTSNAGDVLEYIVEVVLITTTNGRSLNVHNGKHSTITITEMKI